MGGAAGGFTLVILMPDPGTVADREVADAVAGGFLGRLPSGLVDVLVELGRAHRVFLGEHDLSAEFVSADRRDFDHEQLRALSSLDQNARRAVLHQVLLDVDAGASRRCASRPPRPRHGSTPACPHVEEQNPVHGGHFARPLGADSGRFDQSARPSTR